MGETDRTLKNRQVTATPVAVRFVILLGIVSLFADMTYEGARSINGPFLAILGASGAVVGIVSGLGELIGYTLRLVSGFISDRTKRYWTVLFFGYAVNLIAVPALALAGNWPLAASLMIVERFGKGIRVPPRDAMLSYATQQMGRGWGFGLHEALDQIGAILGPLIVAAVLSAREGYRFGYSVLLIPALLALGVLSIARHLYPQPQDLEISPPKLQVQGFTRVFWLYIAAASLVAAGFADFPLIAYHFEKASVVSPAMVPILYAIAMAVDALAALLFGRLFDHIGLTTMIIVALITSAFAPLVFLGSFYAAVMGMAMWGVGMGAQESIMRAAIGNMVPSNRRSFAYGVFNTSYGISWFLGSLLIGILYDVSIPALVSFSVTAQLASIPIFYSLRKQFR